MADQHQRGPGNATESKQDNPSSNQMKTNENTKLSKSFLGNVIEICIVTNDYKQSLRSLSKLGIGPWRVYTFTPENTSNQTYHGKPSPFRLKVCFADLPGTHNEKAGLVYEVIQPLPLQVDDSDSDNQKIENNIFAEFLDKSSSASSSSQQTKKNVAGIHHIAYDLNNIPFEEREAEFFKRGFQMTQGGSWLGLNHFAFYEPVPKNKRGRGVGKVDDNDRVLSESDVVDDDDEDDEDDNDPGTVFETIAFPDDWEYPEPEEWFPPSPFSS